MVTWYKRPSQVTVTTLTLLNFNTSLNFNTYFLGKVVLGKIYSFAFANIYSFNKERPIFSKVHIIPYFQFNFGKTCFLGVLKNRNIKKRQFYFFTKRGKLKFYKTIFLHAVQTEFSSRQSLSKQSRAHIFLFAYIHILGKIKKCVKINLFKRASECF